MLVKLKRDGEQINTDKIFIEFSDGETVKITHSIGQEDTLFVNASNDTTEMIVKPIVANEIELRFQSH
ncbi:MAG: hypothetical protein GY794_15500 [bacterium]|nr:hypothetical protein [bacterium]